MFRHLRLRPQPRPALTLTLGWKRLNPQPPCSVAHPLRAALAGDLDPPGVGTVPAGQPDVLAAQWHTGEAAVLTAAANPAVGLEDLAITVPAPVHLTAPIIPVPCGGETGPPSVILNFSLSRAVPVTSLTWLSQQSWPRSRWGDCTPTASEHSPGAPAAHPTRSHGRPAWCLREDSAMHPSIGFTGRWTLFEPLY